MSVTASDRQRRYKLLRFKMLWERRSGEISYHLRGSPAYSWYDILEQLSPRKSPCESRN